MKCNNYGDRLLFNHFLLIVLLCGASLCVVPACMQEPQNIENKDGAGKEHTSMELITGNQSLLDAIASRNLAPTIKGPSSGPPLFGDEFDWSDYERVTKAITNLETHAEQEWPELLMHFEDKRYSTTTDDAGGGPHNYCVGDICKRIVRKALTRGYIKHFHKGLSTEVHYHQIRYQAEDQELREWCEERKAKRLYELQIEMCEWAVAKVMKSKYITDEERKPFVDAVQAEIAELQKTKKANPIPIGYEEDFEYYRRPVPPSPND